MISSVLTVGGFLLSCIGGIRQYGATAHLKPECERRANLAGFWLTERYTNEGQRIIRQSWRWQLLGVAAFLIGVALP